MSEKALENALGEIADPEFGLAGTSIVASSCQRWEFNRCSFRPAGEIARVGQYFAEAIPEKVAKAFVQTHHYSGSMPATILNVGLFRHQPFDKERLVGVASFSVPCNNHVVPAYTGLPAAQGIELGRFVLRQSEPGNAESHFLGQAFRVLKEHKPHIKAVVSYSDPIPRTLITGEVIKPGHIGGIYQSFNGRYVGRSSRRTLLLTESGTVISERTLTKIRKQEKGWLYAERQLVEAGAAKRPTSEDPGDWLARVLNDPATPLRRLRHPGNHCYAWPLGSQLERKFLRREFAPSLPYPRLYLGA
jgi:hypothetical protein